MPGYELSGVVAALGYRTTGLTVGQRVSGPTDRTRDGSLAEYAAVEARNLAPLPADVDHIVAAALPISGLTAWQDLFDHRRLAAGQTVLIHGAAGGVGSIAVQLAREAGARVIGTGRAADRDTALGLGADAFLDLQPDQLEDAGEVDVVFDVIGGDVLGRPAALVRAGGTLVTIATPPEVQPREGRAVFFAVEPDRARLADLARQLPDRRVWARWVGCCHVGSGRPVRGDGLYRRADRTGDDRERCLSARCWRAVTGPGWTRLPSRLVHYASALAAPLGRLAGVRRVLDSQARRIQRSRAQPGAGQSIRSDVVAVAGDAGGRTLAAVHLTGGDPYSFTAPVLAWAAGTAAAQGVRPAGALGPVEAFGLGSLESACADAGFSREPVR